MKSLFSDAKESVQRIEIETLARSRPGFIKSPQFEQRFDVIMAILIAMNCLQIGISLDVVNEWEGWFYADMLFAVAFLLELGIKLGIHGCRGHFCADTWVWS